LAFPETGSSINVLIYAKR